MVQQNHYANSTADAAAKSINAGVDLNTGFVWTDGGVGGGMRAALARGWVTQATLDTALRRGLRQRFQVGLFDPLAQQPYAAIPLGAINATAHADANLDAALQALVLLKNDGGALPLAPGARLAVVGPHATSHNLFSDYAGDLQCWNDPQRTRYCIPTIGDWLARANAGGTTTVQAGVGISSSNVTGVPAALAAVAAADVVVLCLGIDTTIEHEGVDRSSVALPGLQDQFAAQVLAAAGERRVVLVLVNGGMVAVDAIAPRAAAVVEAFYPAARGAEALARALFGEHNRWGKLPVTIYRAAYMASISLMDMNMTSYPGRTYRYMHNDTMALFPFGFGLSYTTFSLACAAAIDTGAAFNVMCTLRNTGAMDGDEVVLAYHQPGAAVRAIAEKLHPVPKRRLVAFERAHVAAATGKLIAAINNSVTLTFSIAKADLQLTTADGSRRTYPGLHYLVFSRGHGTNVTLPVTLAT